MYRFVYEALWHHLGIQIWAISDIFHIYGILRVYKKLCVQLVRKNYAIQLNFSRFQGSSLWQVQRLTFEIDKSVKSVKCWTLKSQTLDICLYALLTEDFEFHHVFGFASHVSGDTRVTSSIIGFGCRELQRTVRLNLNEQKRKKLKRPIEWKGWKVEIGTIANTVNSGQIRLGGRCPN